MALSRIIPILCSLLLVSVAVMTAAARDADVLQSAAGAALAALSAVMAGVAINRPLVHLEAHRITSLAAPIAGRRNARLMALVYGWGGLALFAIYTIGGLRWQHGWQYGAGMTLIAVLLFGYAIALGQDGSRFREPRAQLAVLRLTLLQGVGATAGLGFLLLSGKLTAGKADWAANHVFLAGGVAVAILSFLAALVQRRLSKPRV